MTKPTIDDYCDELAKQFFVGEIRKKKHPSGVRVYLGKTIDKDTHGRAIGTKPALLFVSQEGDKLHYALRDDPRSAEIFLAITLTTH